MPVINRIAEFQTEIMEWRRDIHAHPEILYDVHRTADKVAGLLTGFGVDEVVTGIGQTGIVGIIRGRTSDSGRVIGLRADMDALPIAERTGKPYASTIEGKMHACGHDGHTAMLLGAAKYLTETRNFDGSVALIFQPAEEGGAGGKAMLEDGMIERFGIEEVYGMHNFPGMPVGHFGICEGGMMAAADEFVIQIEGVGGHAARPQHTSDPVIIAAQIVQALQTVVSRNVDPMEHAVLSVTMIEAGETFNIVPNTARITGTVRTLKDSVRELMEHRIGELVRGIAAAFDTAAILDYRHGYPVTVNAPRQTAFAVRVAELTCGPDRVDTNITPSMGAEDFSYMAQVRPGAFIFIGQGDTAELHQDSYDFNDEIIPTGSSYWVNLVEAAMPLA